MKTVTGFEHDAYGHIILTVRGLDLTGVQEIERLERAGHRIDDSAKSMLTSTRDDGYDMKHHIADRPYKLALIRGIQEGFGMSSTEDLHKLAAKYGYGKLLAGIAPRICDTIANEQVSDMGVSSIAVLHDPIVDSFGDPSVLGVSYLGGSRFLGSRWVRPGDLWSSDCFFAFLLSALPAG